MTKNDACVLADYAALRLTCNRVEEPLGPMRRRVHNAERDALVFWTWTMTPFATRRRALAATVLLVGASSRDARAHRHANVMRYVVF